MRNRQAQLERDAMLFLFGALVGLLLGLARCDAKDLGQWGQETPQIREWYRSLMQPDVPQASCCGEADAYWADSYEVTKEGEYIAIVTDEREDAPLQRAHVPIGTRIVIPRNKLKYDQSNPTGHGIVFLSKELFVWCYLAPGGV